MVLWGWSSSNIEDVEVIDISFQVYVQLDGATAKIDANVPG